LTNQIFVLQAPKHLLNLKNSQFTRQHQKLIKYGELSTATRQSANNRMQQAVLLQQILCKEPIW